MHSDSPPPPGPYGYAPQPRYQQTVVVQQQRGGCLKAVLIGVGVLMALGLLGVMFGGGSDTDTDTGGTASSARSERDATEPADDAGGKSEKPRKPAPPGIGDVVRDGKFAFKVTRVRKGLTEVGEGFTTSTAQGQYVLIYLTVKNIGDEAQLFDGTSQKLIDAKGRQFDTATGTAAVSLPGSNAFLNNINPGNTVKGILLFDVPKNITLRSLELHDSFLSGGVTVLLR
ncbi:DUF4352 domain-containing protein [Thermopolyspora sp. NPDC052614]|uniref:DUF4352 domain-containing protein n=1 Tax=Thermopolyspora sp. NPDC052614 TaxID=3155682 RepID=UPI003421CB44